MRWWGDEVMRWWGDEVMRWCGDEVMRWWGDDVMRWWGDRPNTIPDMATVMKWSISVVSTRDGSTVDAPKYCGPKWKVIQFTDTQYKTWMRHFYDLGASSCTHCSPLVLSCINNIIMSGLKMNANKQQTSKQTISISINSNIIYNSWTQNFNELKLTKGQTYPSSLAPVGKAHSRNSAARDWRESR
jgi:hypothetical protein